MEVGEIFFAGGGTAGHLAPGFALREALALLGVPSRFVTPGEARERGWFPPNEPEPLHVAAPRLPRGAIPAAAFPLRMSGSVVRALALLRRERPAAVVALGGWPCAPTALAALVAGIPLALVAVDRVPGVVVRTLATFAGRVYLAADTARAEIPNHAGVRVFGPLVRAGAAAGTRNPARFGLTGEKKTLFVVGGSLGARGLNRAAVAGLAGAVAADPTLVDRIQVLHSTGPGEDAETRAAYEGMGLLAFVTPYVQAMGDALVTADLVLCRGGASTLAEIEALARPAVVVPYPHHADRQQWKNAEPLVARGAAVLVEEAALTPGAFSTEVLDRLLNDRPRAPALGADPDRPSGAALAAADIVRWIKEEGRSAPRSASVSGSKGAVPAEASPGRALSRT